MGRSDIAARGSVRVAASGFPLRNPDPADLWRAILERAGAGDDAITDLLTRHRAEDPHFLTEIRQSGLVPDAVLYAGIAEELGLTLERDLDADTLLLPDSQIERLLAQPSVPPIMRRDGGDEPAVHLLAPDRLDLARLIRLTAHAPHLKRRLRLVEPVALRRALLRRCADRLTHKARETLSDRFPEMSARIVSRGWQGALFGGIFAFVVTGGTLMPHATLASLHAVASLFFMACIGLRIAAAMEARPPAPIDLGRYEAANLPVYSVVIALYREAAVVPDLLVALGRLVWPRSRIEVKLVCEADDRETLDALYAQPLKPWIEVVEVPPSQPRTKPKALSYALNIVSGSLIVVYDAEDRPHPLQLLEAHQRFCREGDDLACLQAPLTIGNRTDGSIARGFAFEYAALFRGLLPFLARRNLLLPLGGTSNHFRREALEASGAWDPYNVTEDADLAVRFARLGYRTGMIAAPTIEDAPTRWSVWVPQRARWLKGWMQVWLVHMRHPLRLLREIGPGSFLLVQILFLGMVGSVLLHPLLLATGAYLTVQLLRGVTLTAPELALLVVDIFNLAFAYLSFLLLGRRTLARGERSGFWKTALFTPIYWLAMSLAGFKALGQIVSRPHHWDKTPHAPRTALRKAGKGA